MKSPSLRQLQKQFKTAVVSGRAPLSILRLVRDTAPFSRQQRMSVYQRAYWLRLEECIATDFPAVGRLMGKRRFAHFLRAYLTRFPSTVWNISEVADRLPHVLKAPLYRNVHPALPDLAHWEWQKHAIHYHAAPEALDSKKLAGLSMDQIENARLILNPTLQALNSKFQLTHVRPSRRPAAIKTFIVYKSLAGVESRSLSEREARLLKYLQRPRTLKSVNRWLSTQGLTPRRASFLFAEWVREQLIVDLTVAK